jgi:hypothetical protein
MSKVTSDGHLRLSYQPALAAVLPSAEIAGPPKSAAWDKALDDRMRRTNAGVRLLELLPGNIRYVAYDSFGWNSPGAEQSMATAMEFLRGGDAIIIDLRNNPGGYAAAEAALTSYFLPPQTKLLDFEMRDGAPAEGTATSAAPFTLAGKPAYILIGPATLSAAEGFAAHASGFGFGTLVGETTGGAGYTVRGFPLPGGYVFNVSVGRTINAATGTDWEGSGVRPTIAVAADKALFAAEAAATEKLLAGMTDQDRPLGKRLLQFYRAQAYPVAAALPLAAYAGRYGDFSVVAGSGGLSIRFRDFSPERLIPLAPDLFAPDAEPSTQVHFVAQEGAIVALELDTGNGPPARTARTGP